VGKVSMDDVAKLAEVSKATVSKVFNNDESISQATRNKVLEAAKKFDYRPSLIPGALKTRKTKAIGLILPNVMNPFFPGIIKGVEDVAVESGYMVIFCNSDERLKKEALYFQMFEDRWVDGIIISGVTGKSREEKEYIQRLHKKGIPVVFIDREIESYFTSVVMIDNGGAAFKGTEHCLDLGHKRIGFISASLDIKIFTDRFKGYQKALEENGIEFDQSLVIEGNQTIQSGKEATKQLLSLDDPPTAIFAVNDLIAIGVLKEIQERGLKVPEDISVIGFDDIPLASLVNPALTTIAQPIYEIGREAVNLLIKNIEKKGLTKSKIILDTKLIVRESTAPLKRR